ncbi:helix-turn-helix transcriptional regulator [Agromyces sp. MMS24-JH15]|uniref:helix-turn-helix transcriptional regulator n=1 Tax=Agromyces sp. MMS24-JH15 TaxID=3243765 RepID=UPI003748B92D
MNASASRRPEKAQDKLVFLLALVPYLLEEGSVGVGDAARHFGVSPERIREAVKLIAMSGLPDAGGFYWTNDLFDIDWSEFEDDDVITIVHHVAIDEAPRLSSREAAALVAGLTYLAGLPENAGSEQVAALLAKLRAGASGDAITVGVTPADDPALVTVRSALASGRQLGFQYRNAQGGHSRRRVDPLLIRSLGADWYLQAWCHTRDGVRSFRVDRMTELEVLDAPAVAHPGVEVPETLFQAADTDVSVIVDVVPDALPLIADYVADSASEQVGDRLRVTLRLAHLHGLKRLVARMPGLVTVVAPPEARAVVADWASEGLAAYDRTEGRAHPNG